MTLLQGSRDAIVMLWTVGGLLRRIYRESTSEEQQAADRQRTLSRALIFTLWSAAVGAVEWYQWNLTHTHATHIL